jgi:hypothetical protein
MVVYIKKSAGFWAALLVVGLFLILNRPNNKTETDNVLIINAFSIDDGWGFNVLKDDSLLIAQPFIPMVSGIKRFKTKDDAMRTGNLMITKLKSGVFPPTISLAELDSLQVIR